jgi:hypothetical protein
VAINRRHLRGDQTDLEEAAESLVAEIVEVEVIQTSPSPDALPWQPEGIGRDRK